MSDAAPSWRTVSLLCTLVLTVWDWGRVLCGAGVCVVMRLSTVIYLITMFLFVLIVFVISVVAWRLFSRDFSKLGE
jgi:hypothetical protein